MNGLDKKRLAFYGGDEKAEVMVHGDSEQAGIVC